MDKKQKRFTDEELTIIKGLFKNNEKGLKVLRKVFLPTYDFDAPFGQAIDLWMTLKLENMSPMEREVNILARNQLIYHLEFQLQQLQFLANEEEETEEEKKLKAEKNSAK